jgi:hypothetical protein
MNVLEFIAIVIAIIVAGLVTMTYFAFKFDAVKKDDEVKTTSKTKKTK